MVLRMPEKTFEKNEKKTELPNKKMFEAFDTNVNRKE